MDSSRRRPELLDLVAVTATSGEPAVQVGDVGTVVELLHPDGVEVEFLTSEGRTRHVGSFPVRSVLTLNHGGDKHYDTDLIGERSIRWARQHVINYGDTDILPNAFEYSVLAGPAWEAVYDELRGTNFAAHAHRPFRRYLVPKHGGGFRIAHRLDPIDAIIYSAAAYEMSADIESHREREEHSLASSYHVDATEDGRLYSGHSGWTDYNSRSQELARRYDFVLETDIADFYSRISHDGLAQALRETGVSEARIESLERFLGCLEAGQREGIPVGPAASHLLAEACLGRVDRMLLAKGCEFVRYVDDFRVFSNDHSAAVTASYELAQYLDASYRLAVQDSKTVVRPTADLLRNRLAHAQRAKDEDKEQRLTRLIAEMREHAGYETDAEEWGWGDDDSRRSLCSGLAELVSEALAGNPIRFGTIRHALRRAHSLRIPALEKALIDNLGVLAPVLRDVCNYLVSTFPKDRRRARAIGDGLIGLASASDYTAFPYVQLWVLHTLCARPAASTYEAVADLAQKAESELGIRPQALAARAFGQADWVRERKGTAMDLEHWDRRALIWAGQTLPRKERHAWLAPFEQAHDPLDRAVASHVLGAR